MIFTVKIPKEYSNEKMLKMKRGWSGCKTIREGSEGVAFSSDGGRWTKDEVVVRETRESAVF